MHYDMYALGHVTGCLKNATEVTRVLPDGKVQHKVHALSRFARKGQTAGQPDLSTAMPQHSTTWIPRHSLNRTLYNHLHAHHANAVRVRPAHRCVARTLQTDELHMCQTSTQAAAARCAPRVVPHLRAYQKFLLRCF